MKTKSITLSALTAFVLMLLAALLLPGCTGVPANRITADIHNGRIDITAPKNTSVQGFDLTRDTNGNIRLTIQSWVSTNDAAVISKAAAGQAAILNQWKGIAAGMAEAAARGAAK